MASWHKSLIDKLRISVNYVLHITLKENIKKELFYPLYQQLKILPAKHLVVYKILKYIKSGNSGKNTLFYSTWNLKRGDFKIPIIIKILLDFFFPII